jgi:hypothetical protein
MILPSICHLKTSGIFASCTKGHSKTYKTLPHVHPYHISISLKPKEEEEEERKGGGGGKSPLPVVLWFFSDPLPPLQRKVASEERSPHNRVSRGRPHHHHR